jgi:cytochrome c-type biogenesis protein CcmH
MRYVWLLILFLLLTVSGSAVAQMGGEELPPGVTDGDVYRVSNEMYCEVCQGVPISACPSPTCARWRQEIANLLGEGRNDEEIMRYFSDTYGDEVTGIPLAGGQRNLSLLIPLIVILAIGVGVSWQIWRNRQRGLTQAQQAAQAAGLRPEYARPVPDNVDSAYLERFLKLLEEE